MNANKRRLVMWVSAVVGFGAMVDASLAEPLDARSTTKVNNAKAQAWKYQGEGRQNPELQKDPALQKQVVNIGSKRNNTCNLNVGSTQTAKPRPGESRYGQRAPKEVIVTTKDVINICK